MQGIDILVNQHNNVLTFTYIVKEKCKKIFNGEEINIEFFEKILEFGRYYVDKHHHKEEENILFKIMIDNLGANIAHIINDGMLFDHNVGRMYLMNLEYAIQDYKMFQDDENKLKILSNAFGYADMMENHISKENEVLYPFAENNLADNKKEECNNQINEFEQKGYEQGIQTKYLNLLDELKIILG